MPVALPSFRERDLNLLGFGVGPEPGFREGASCLQSGVSHMAWWPQLLGGVSSVILTLVGGPLRTSVGQLLDAGVGGGLPLWAQVESRLSTQEWPSVCR